MRLNSTGSRPWRVWAVPFAVLTVLLVDNAFLFSAPEYENADMAANSILIEQARRFTLLVGNYSRERFNHPGPAFLYVESWGESLCYDALHVVPTPWNGQLIALSRAERVFRRVGGGRCLRLDPVVARRRGGPGGGAALRHAAPGDIQLGLDALRLCPRVPRLRGRDRLRGRRAHQDAWLAALTGWFLINGHAAFLIFVPALSAAALAALPGRAGVVDGAVATSGRGRGGGSGFRLRRSAPCSHSR